MPTEPLRISAQTLLYTPVVHAKYLKLIIFAGCQRTGKRAATSIMSRPAGDFQWEPFVPCWCVHDAPLSVGVGDAHLCQSRLPSDPSGGAYRCSALHHHALVVVIVGLLVEVHYRELFTRSTHLTCGHDINIILWHGSGTVPGRQSAADARDSELYRARVLQVPASI